MFSYVKMMEEFGLSEFAALPSFDPVTPTPVGKPMKEARVGLFSSVGAHLPSQPAFEPINDLSFRLVPTSVEAGGLLFDHPSPIRGFALQDLNVVFPRDRLVELEAEGTIGSLAEYAVSMLGSITRYSELVEETAPSILAAFEELGVDVALLVPFCPACHRSTTLLARALEAHGLPCITMSALYEMHDAFRPARPVFCDFPLGATVGRPGDEAMQRAVLRSAIEVGDEASVPWRIRTLPYEWAEDREWENDVRRIYEREGREIHRQRVATHMRDGETLQGREAELNIKCAC